MKSLSLLIVTLFLFSCSNNQSEPEMNPDYEAEIKSWQDGRYASLTRPDGWNSLAGLFWLQTGENSFGGDPSNDCVFPAEKSAPFMGTFFLTDGAVRMVVKDGVNIYAEDVAVSDETIYGDVSKSAPTLTYQSLSWFVIKRGEQYGVRLKDATHPALAAFKPLNYYPVDQTWRVEARLEAYPEPKTIAVDNIIGITTEEVVEAALVFEYDGKTHRLDPIDSGDEYFIIFADETNSEETYGAGRYLYAKKTSESEPVVIDFNLAYNPPCAFTEFATCPLPPAQNRLALSVTAGEKYRQY